MPGPDHGAAGCTRHSRHRSHRPGHVGVGDVAEHSAGQHQIGGYGAGIVVSLCGVANHKLDPVPRCRTSSFRQLGVEFDQPRPDITAPRMVDQRAEEIATVAGAQTDYANRSRSGRGEGVRIRSWTTAKRCARA